MGDDTYSRGYRTGSGGRDGSGADPSVDPLSELARLIGQSDPFAVDRQRGAAARAADPHARAADWRGEPPPQDPRNDAAMQGAPYDAERGDHSAPAGHHEPAEMHGGPTDEPGYDGQYQDQSYQDQPYYEGAGGADDPSEDEDYGSGPFASYAGEEYDGDSFYDEAPAPRRRGWLVTTSALVGLAIIGTAGAFAYRAVFTTATPSIIARDPGPNKIMPSNQSVDSRSNKRLDRIASGGQDERVISREEQPIVLPQTARSAPAPGAGQSPGIPFSAAPAAVPIQPGPPADTTMPPPAAPENAGAPRRIHTVTIKTDGSPTDAGPPAAASAPPRPAPPRTAAAAAPPPEPAQNAPLSLTPQSIAQAAPPVRTSALAPQAPAARGGDGGSGSGYFVQVTAQRSEAEAQSSFAGIQAKYEDLLGGHQPVIRRKDLGSKGVFYGAQVGPFSHEAAIKLCESLKSAGGSCMIQKN